VLPWALLVVGLIVTVLLLRPSEPDYPPLDPASPKPDGAKGLVDVLTELGAEVEVSRAQPAAGADADTALLLSDELTEEGRQALVDWVRAGGTLVVADSGSPVTDVDVAGRSDLGVLSPPLERRCEVPALRQVQRVQSPGGFLFEVPPGATGCFTSADGDAWLLVQPLGQGNVVRTGGTGAFVNGNLGKEDNGLLLVSLLAPRPGMRVVVHNQAPPGFGPAGGGDGEGGSVFDLLATGVRTALWQLVVAFVFLALWRGRRLGKPVLEPVPVEIPGSELVLAVGNLLQRARLRNQAASALAGDLRRSLAERLGLPAATPVERVAEVAADRGGVPRERVLAALRADPRDEAALVAAAQTVEAVRREVARGGRPGDDQATALVRRSW
jgi:hypothetical protein